jgi:biopolymer transport protein ExbD
LLIFFFAFLNSKLLLQPGVVVELPKSPFKGGSQARMVAVVLAVRSTDSAATEEIVFFDDERFLMHQEEQQQRLRDAFAKRAAQSPDAELVIQADQKVPYGTVVTIMNMALEVGVRRVNLATKP